MTALQLLVRPCISPSQSVYNKVGKSHLGVMIMAKAIPVRLDDRGRILIPGTIREALHAEPGDIFFIQQDENGMRVIKGEDPFDALADEAIREDDAGETIVLDEILRREGIALDE